MGLSNALSGGIIMFGITYLLFAFSGLTDDVESFSDTSSQVYDLENKLMKTTIDVNIEATPGTNATFSFDITNTNVEKLWQFEKFDVIVTYDSSGITYTEIMTYDTACPPSTGEWCIKTWTDDVLDEEILNVGETITIEVEVNNNLQNNSDLIVVVSTQNGVVATDTVIV